MSGRLEGRVALVTGAARGQGRSHALHLAREGADIIALDLCADIEGPHYDGATPEDLAETVAAVEALDRRVVGAVADIADLPGLTAAVDDAVATLGRLDIAVANAGIVIVGGAPRPTDFTKTAVIDLGGTINTCHVAIPHMVDGGRGALVLIGSVAALTGSEGLGGYAYSKRCVDILTRDLATDLAPWGIRVNTVHPTNVDTGMLHNDAMYRQHRPDLTDPTRADAEEAMRMMMPLGVPHVAPSDISHAVLFLASDEARYVTGASLAVDAGRLLDNMRPGDTHR